MSGITKKDIVDKLRRKTKLQKYGRIKTRYGKTDKGKDQFSISEELYRDRVDE